MKFRHPLLKFACAALVVVAATVPFASSAPAQDATGPQQTVAVIAASGLDQLLTDVDYVGGLVGAPSMRQQAEGMLQLFTGNKKVPGVDDTRNWGVVLTTDGTNFEPMFCIPVTDLSALLTLLQNFDIQASDLGNGLTELELPNQSLYVKEANGWAFAARTPEALDNAPADPDAELKKVSGEYDLGLYVAMQNVPEMIREIAITNLQAGLEEGLQQEEGETNEQFAQRRQITLASLDEIRRAFDEIQEITFGVNIDQEQGIILDTVYSGMTGTRTAREITSLEDVKSRFAKVVKPDASIKFNFASQVAEQDREEYQAQIEASLQSSLEQAHRAIEQEEDDPVKQQLAKDLVTAVFDVFKSTLAEGRIDASGYAIVQPDRLVAAGAIATADASQVNTLLDKVKALAETEPEKVTVTMDAATHSDVALHSIQVAIDDEDVEQLRSLLGEDSLQIYIGAGADATYFAAGRDALTTIQEAIDATESSATTPVTPLEVELSFGHFLQVAASQGEMAGNPAVQQLANKVAGDGKDHISLTLERAGESVRMRVLIEQGVIEALGAFGQLMSAQFAQ